MSEDVRVLEEKIDNMNNNVMHKLRGNEQSIKYVYEEIKDIRNRIKYIAIGVFAAFALVQSGGMDFLKALMQ